MTRQTVIAEALAEKYDLDPDELRLETLRLIRA
jgi:hypothetical protein